MQKQLQNDIVDAIKDGEYQFTRDHLGNNFLAVVPKNHTQIEFLQVRYTQSFIGGDREKILGNLDDLVKGFENDKTKK